VVVAWRRTRLISQSVSREPKKIGDVVKAGEPLMIIHYNDEARATEAARMVSSAYKIEDKPMNTRSPLIVQKDRVRT